MGRKQRVVLTMSKFCPLLTKHELGERDARIGCYLLTACPTKVLVFVPSGGFHLALKRDLSLSKHFLVVRFWFLIWGMCLRCVHASLHKPKPVKCKRLSGRLSGPPPPPHYQQGGNVVPIVTCFSASYQSVPTLAFCFSPQTHCD